MGSWNVSCGVTHLPIGVGDRCVAIFLEKGNNDYGLIRWNIASPAIRGCYDDYGRIAPDESQIYSDLMEDVEQQHKSNTDVLWVHEPIYNALNNLYIPEYGGEGLPATEFYGGDYICSRGLELLGFQLIKKLPNARYNLVYAHPGCDNVFVTSDGKWSGITRDLYQIDKHRSIFNWTAFFSAWKEITGISLDETCLDIPLGTFSWEFDTKEYYSYKDLFDSCKLEALRHSLENALNFSFTQMLNNLQITSNLFKKIHRDNLKGILEIKTLALNMYMANIPFAPRSIGIGPQWGTVYPHYIINTIANQIIEAELAEYKRQEEED